MKKIVTGIFFLTCLSFTARSLPDNEEEVRNRIQQARNSVETAQSAVTDATQKLRQNQEQLQQLRLQWAGKQDEIKLLRDKALSADNSLAKSVEHIDREIDRCRKRLSSLKRNNADAETLDQAQRELTAYENMKNNRLRKSGLTALRDGFLRAVAEKETELAAIRPLLKSAIDRTRQAENDLQAAQMKHADAQLHLADILQKAPALLGHINPPHLDKVKVHGSSGGTYEAQWDDFSKIMDEQIEIIKKGIAQQKEMIAAYKRVIDECGDQLLEQQRITDAKLDAYVNEVKNWSWIKSGMADLLDAGINIARNFKQMGPYAFAYEAVYRIAEPLVYNQPSKWDINKLPSQPNAPVDVTSLAGDMGIAVTKDQVKGLITQALQAYIGTSPFGIPGSGLQYGTEASIAGARTSFRQLVSEGKFWVVADNALNAKWMARLTDPHFNGNILQDAYATLVRSPKAFLQNFKSSFNRDRLKGALTDFVQSSAIQALKEWLDQKRLNLWSDYLIEDMKRTELHDHLKKFGAQRQRQVVILEALNEKLQELIRDKEEQARKPARFLHVSSNGVIKGTDCLITLTFSATTEVDSVVLEGKKAVGKAAGNTWTGAVNISDLRDDITARLVVAARGPVTQKVLDNPVTAAQFAATSQSWTGYEPGSDTYHKIRLQPVREGTSIVLLIDCSGSMGDNKRMERAKAAAEHVISSRQIGPTDELSIMAFRGCGGPELLQAFTSDTALLKQQLKSVYPSGSTALATAMLEASAYLESNAQNRYRKIIVLTDGEESCNGNEFEALTQIRKFHQLISKRIQ